MPSKPAASAPALVQLARSRRTFGALVAQRYEQSHPWRMARRQAWGDASHIEGVWRPAKGARHAAAPLNDRQRDILNRLLNGFEGKLTSTKYAIIEKTSPDTALRDITDLVERGILQKHAGGGRSTSYSLADAGQSTG